jgi:hypothetical protein
MLDGLLCCLQLHVAFGKRDLDDQRVSQHTRDPTICLKTHYYVLDTALLG